MNKTPIRMCISCRGRYPQNFLIRLKQKGKNIVAFDGDGRSLYLCETCIEDKKKIKSLTKRFRLDEEYFIKLLKELIDNG